MSKPLAVAGAPPQDNIFDPLLPVTLPLPYEGHWSRISAVYSMTAVMDWFATWDAEFAAARPALLAADEAVEAATTPDAKQAAKGVQDRLSRERALDIIRRLILRFEWPYAGNPPDPQDPASFARWPTPILLWLSGLALSEVRNRVSDPLSVTGSSPS